MWNLSSGCEEPGGSRRKERETQETEMLQATSELCEVVKTTRAMGEQQAGDRKGKQSATRGKKTRNGKGGGTGKEAWGVVTINYKVGRRRVRFKGAPCRNSSRKEPEPQGITSGREDNNQGLRAESVPKRNWSHSDEPPLKIRIGL